MNSPRIIAIALSRAFLAGDFSEESLVERGTQLLGKRYRWLRPLACRLLAHFSHCRPRTKAVNAFLLSDPGFRRANAKYELSLADLAVINPRMRPCAAAAQWNLPPLRTVRHLAEWLQLTVGQLESYSDLFAWEAKRNRGKLRHYHYRLLAKRFGRVRLIESPKPRLKQLQRQILEEILQEIPPHRAAHGFVRGRSIKSFAAPHAGRAVVLKLDLQDFFPSISFAWVQAVFCTAGYPDRVADYLAGLCTNTAPGEIWFNSDLTTAEDRRSPAVRLYSQPHLPQGAPTSPMLANLCAYRLDCRFAALAEAAGATYTRYADDLAFSGDAPFARGVKRFLVHVAVIAFEEGFRVNHPKTRIMRDGVRQRLTGLVVNSHPNLPRREFDRLKAMLTNCQRCGPASQNRENHEDFRAHLTGRVAFLEMINPQRGAKLRKLLNGIDW